MTDQVKEEETEIVQVDLRKAFIASLAIHDATKDMPDIEQAIAFCAAAISLFGKQDVAFYELLGDVSPQVHEVLQQKMAEQLAAKEPEISG